MALTADQSAELALYIKSAAQVKGFRWVQANVLPLLTDPQQETLYDGFVTAERARITAAQSELVAAAAVVAAKER